MQGFQINSTKVNISLTLENKSLISADIVMGSKIRVENGMITTPQGIYVVNFYTQNTGFVLVYQQDLSPEDRMSIHQAVEEFIRGAISTLTENMADGESDAPEE